MTTPFVAFFHPDTKAVRFSVQIDDQSVGASITQSTLHYRFRPTAVNEDPLDTYAANIKQIEDAVRRRVAEGSIEPVMVREFDLRQDV